MRLQIRPREEIQKHDWYLVSETDEYGLETVVQADSFLQADNNTKIVAVCFQRNEPVYLMGRDARLYYHIGSDDIINQFFPMDDFLRWKNGQALAFSSPTPSREYWPSFPEGWRYCRCHGDAFILIVDEIAMGFDDAVIAGRYGDTYHILRSFPRVIEQTLILSGKESVSI